MNMLAATFLIGSVIGVVILIGLHTKSGKKWLNEL